MKMSTSANTISITANPFSSILRDLVLPAGGVMSSSPLGMKLGIDYLSVSAGTENSDYCLTHQHNAWVIVGSLEGHARVTRGSFCVDIAPGSVYIIPPSLSFQERNIGTTHWKWMVLMVYTTGDVPFLANFPYTPAVFQANVFFFEQFARLLMSVNQQEASDRSTNSSPLHCRRDAAGLAELSAGQARRTRKEGCRMASVRLMPR